ncbi:metal-dependent hydrolase [Natrinema sp. CBA1119]|uniref:metal-dependent hydrolase n=1 Tax=Natrinema sp. CBA1119 TaxID=1608465 RepID=UPI000BFA8FB9|nr:metal-dependent hydrolase [Natrinema sp. CBA1119]PGF15183.1 metal-dependent hydrolase [Natrinema sp. CBA1119]
MWPWEHLAFAYVLYSLTRNVLSRTAPSTQETIAVAVGSQFPDLLDKPLAWTFGVMETGYAVGHSIFAAPFIILVAYAVAARRGDRILAGAFAFAHLSHPVADLLNRILSGRAVDLRIVLWPIESPPPATQGGFIDHFARYFIQYVNAIVAGGLTLQVVFQSLLALAVLALWLFDGAPVAADIWRGVHAQRQQ